MPGNSIVSYIVERIASTPVELAPFPHIVVERLLPDHVFDEVLSALPPRSQYDRVDYPGTGFGVRGRSYHAYGLAYGKMSESTGPLGDLYRVLSSNEFEQALIRKFNSPPESGGVMAIPESKQRFCNGRADGVTTVFDLQVDLPGYAIAPHPDVESKIVTFQLYLVRDSSLAEYGTLLCEPKDGRALRGRSRAARGVARVIGQLPHESPLFRRMERSSLGMTLGIGQCRSWLPWSWFNVVKTAQALPNHFLAFAPNRLSFHAVDLRIPVDAPVQEREVVRGFVRAGTNTGNWIAPHRAGAR